MNEATEYLWDSFVADFIFNKNHQLRRPTKVAKLQEYYWILKDEEEDEYKCAANAHDTVPKLYRTEGYARAASTNAELQYGHGWKPVKVKIQIVTE
jgi:hypothetical protein